VDGEELAGGVANAGKVTRVGGDVLRPANPNSESVHAFLRSLRTAGFTGASHPVAIESDGRERLQFIEGDVPLPPYPSWAQTDDALASIAHLMRSFHEASAAFRADADATWSPAMSDPSGGPIVCHNDVCLENVVFRSGVAVGLLDFDYASPGRPVYDLSQMVRMCVPVDDDLSASRLGWLSADRPARLRLAADAYGLDVAARRELFEIVSDSIARGGEFVRRRVEAGDPGFVRMWDDMGGMERFDRRRRWWAEQRPAFGSALASTVASEHFAPGPG
jgi:Phosphotransferase enzyme family